MVDVAEDGSELSYSGDDQVDDDNVEGDDFEEETAESSSSTNDGGESSGNDKEDETETDFPKKGQEISGWADSISKILNSTKPKHKKELILSRARKDYEVNKSLKTINKTGHKAGSKLKDQNELEIIPNKPKDQVQLEDKQNDEATTTASATTTKKKDGEALLSLKVQRRLELKQKKLELAWENLARMNAEKTDPQLEKDLVKMATKGVVQLFNAISMQQKTIKTKLKSSEKSEFKKDKVLHQTKDIFDDAMKKSKKLAKSAPSDPADQAEIKEEELSSSDDDDEPQNVTGSIKLNKNKRKLSDSHQSLSSVKKKPIWNAIQDDFMLDAKLKDWDKDSSSGSE